DPGRSPGARGRPGGGARRGVVSAARAGAATRAARGAGAAVRLRRVDRARGARGGAAQAPLRGGPLRGRGGDVIGRSPPALGRIDKEAGISSHDAVERLRRIVGTRRVGHAGTLDPFATGLLLLGWGRATRLLSFLAGLRKVYAGTLALGAATDTLDATGRVVE